MAGSPAALISFSRGDAATEFQPGRNKKAEGPCDGICVLFATGGGGRRRQRARPSAARASWSSGQAPACSRFCRASAPTGERGLCFVETIFCVQRCDFAAFGVPEF